MKRTLNLETRLDPSLNVVGKVLMVIMRG